MRKLYEEKKKATGEQVVKEKRPAVQEQAAFFFSSYNFLIFSLNAFSSGLLDPLKFCLDKEKE
jgi:hypothetical protein